MSEPVFAVVGHPNKGKSSLVAALAQDETVRVGPEPGTTIKARRYPMRVDGETLYTLVDTPGFQRARAALEWLRSLGASASERPEAVARFVRAHRHGARFVDECELLAPIVEGAGILYVVDGAVPYASEYEAEMEILRWTGQPSIAVVNPIGDDRHVHEWARALGQYFRIVRVLDALDAPFDKRLQVLSAFGELREDWRAPLMRAVAALDAERARARAEAALAIAELIEQALTLKVEQRLGADEAAESRRVALEQRYRQRLRAAEQRCRSRVEALYRHERVQRQERELELVEEDLFSQDTWLAFGLSRAALARAGAVGGALAGFGIDVAAGGGSLLLGATLGAVIGGVGSWLSANALAELKVEALPLGGRLARYGPTRNPNLAFVLLGRARLHHALVAGRSHARRTPLDVDTAGALNPLDDSQRDRLARSFGELRRSDSGSERRARARDALAEALGELLATTSL